MIRLLEANNPDRFGRRSKNTEVWQLDPEKLTEKQIDVLAARFMKQFVGDDPTTLAEARKELEAGAVVIEAESTAVET